MCEKLGSQAWRKERRIAPRSQLRSQTPNYHAQEDAQKARPPYEDLPRVRAAIYVAQEVGARLGERGVLQRAVPADRAAYGATAAVMSFLKRSAAVWASSFGSVVVHFDGTKTNQKCLSISQTRSGLSNAHVRT